MRISSKTFQLQWLTSFQRQQAELAVTQQQVSSGKRISTAADDPAGTAQAVLLQQGLDRIGNYAANGEVARRRLSLEEGALTQAGDVLNRLRELAIQAGSGTQTTETRGSIADEAEELLANLLDIANAQDGEGRYLFSGNLVQVRPFAPGATVSYQGDDGSRFQRIGDTRTVQEGDAGSAVFMDIASGNGTFSIGSDPGNHGTMVWKSAYVGDPAAWLPDTYTLSFTAPDTWEVLDGASDVIASGTYQPGSVISFAGVSIELEGTPEDGDSFTIAASTAQSVFQTAQDLVAALRTNTSTPAGRATFSNRLNASLQNLDQGLANLGSIRSQVGARLGTIERQLDGNADQALQLSQTISTIRDLDYATAISQLELRLASLEAAQASYARMRSYSLFNFI